MEIWKNILLKNVTGKKFKNAKTISEIDVNKQFQVFEVLVTETLAVIDPTTEWHSLPVQGDEGIDFIGQIQQTQVPYLISKPNEVVLGQVKRRAGAYTKDSFHLDIIKIIEYYNKQYSQQAALFEIIHVLSTDKNINPTNWIENITFPYASYKILPLNAIDFLKFWKINPSFIKQQLEGVYTETQLDPLFNYINNLQEKWDDLIKINITVDNYICMDDEIKVRVSFESSVDLALSIYLEWTPSDDISSNVAVVYPTEILKNNITRYSISIYKKLELTIRLKAIRSGIQNLGVLSIYSTSGELISNYELGKVEVHKGIANKFFVLPFNSQMKSIKDYILNQSSKSYKAYAIIGQGGIGKSRLAQEISIYAQNHKYYTVAVQNANDFTNSRNIILDLLIKILDIQETGVISYENVYETLRQKLGVNFLAEWNQPILNYVLNLEIGDRDLEKIAKCILTLLIIQLHNQPLFIWLSDMHWASKETFCFFEKLLNLLKLNKEYLINPLVFLFEGRDGDTLELENRIIFPYKWLGFCENENIEKCLIPAWRNDYSQDYIRMLINPTQKPETENMRDLTALVNNYASGNPMHIKELIHYLIEGKNVFVGDDGELSLINRTLSFDSDLTGIKEIIVKRIQFYHEKYSDIIDYYIILASLSNNVTDIYEYIRRKLSKKYYNYSIIEKEIGIVSNIKAEKIFIHEYYKELLKNQFVKDEKNLLDICNFYQKNYCESINGMLDMVTLQLLFEDPHFYEISKTLLELLQQDITDYQALACYQLLLKVPPKFRKDILLSKIYFEMSEIAIRIGSWKDSQKYLEKIYSLKHEDEEEELYYILACKNLGNMYGVGLELKESLSICEIGLKKVENKLSNNKFKDEQMKAEFERQYEMLLNRIAVTYWFSGQATVSAPYQEKALQLAERRGDIYSTAHTLYETGMRQLHEDILLGNSNIKKALDLLPKKGKYTEVQEHYLVRTELLISQLLIYQKDIKNTKLLKEILKDSEIICEELSIGNANYESALCHIVNAICHIFEENYEIALNCFLIALDCANLGEFNTLRWKLYLNIAETCLLLYEQKHESLFVEQSVKYAQYGKKILEEAIKINNNMPSYQKLVEIPCYYFGKILNQNVEFPQNIGIQIPISISYKTFCFYIMD